MRMEIKSEKKKDGNIIYREYFHKCPKCSKEGVDMITARRTANSMRLARKLNKA